MSTAVEKKNILLGIDMKRKRNETTKHVSNGGGKYPQSILLILLQEQMT